MLLPFALAALGLIVALALVARYGQAAVAGSRAQSTADAAALAAVHAGRPAAHQLIADAAATLVSLEETTRHDADETVLLVRVVVSVDGQLAEATAEGTLLAAAPVRDARALSPGASASEP